MKRKTKTTQRARVHLCPIEEAAPDAYDLGPGLHVDAVSVIIPLGAGVDLGPGKVIGFSEGYRALWCNFATRMAYRQYADTASQAVAELVRNLRKSGLTQDVELVEARWRTMRSAWRQR